MQQAWVNAKEEPVQQQIARDGSLLSLSLAPLALGTVYYNAQIMHDDYPPAIRAKALPMTEQDKRERVIATVLFLGSFIGGIVRSNVRLRARNDGHLSFGAAFLNAYAVFVFCSAFDFVVLDYLVLIGLRPSWGMLPGTEDMTAEYRDYRFHFIGFLKGLAYGLMPSLLIAFFTSQAWGRPYRRPAS